MPVPTFLFSTFKLFCEVGSIFKVSDWKREKTYKGKLLGKYTFLIKLGFFYFFCELWEIIHTH